MSEIHEILEETAFLQCKVNGVSFEEEIHPSMSLLDLLREELKLTGTHMGCMTGHCGACTVSVDGRIIKSCITPAASVQRKKVITIEGLAGADDSLHPVQEAFCEASGFQCGYCAPGMVFSTVELLNEHPDPSDAQIRKALTGNLCRCTGYQSIVRSVRQAANQKTASGDHSE